jgi:hypothetical protein
MTMLVNWKTGLTGVAAILTALAAALTAYLNGGLTADALITNGAAIIAGVGLIFGKDWNVRGTGK